MKSTLFRHTGLASCLGAIMLVASSVASAVPLDIYEGPIITDAMKADPRACLNVGDAVSCSAGMLNVLSGLSATADTNDATPGYVLASPQGDLKTRIVVGMGGNAATDNGDTDPTVGKVEDGFITNNPNATFTATGTTGQTTGNLANPDNNLLTLTYDQLGTWDVEIGWLINALTVDGVRRELMIGFDYNQPQNSTGSVDYWALISVLDYDASGNIQGQKTFEINNDIFTGYGAFTSTKTFNSKPNGNEFATVNTKTCYKLTGGVVTDVYATPTGSCLAGYLEVNNAQGNESTEILAFLPELNSGLEGYLAAGYDAISVRMLFGCFNKTGDAKSGVGYLSSGSTTNCDGGGTADVYLLAGQPMPNKVPEPGSLALLGLALGGLAWSSRRRVTRS